MRRARHSYPTPQTILGSACALWLKADRFDVATGVSRVYDRAKGSAQDAVQATTGNQPTAYGISSVTGRRYIKGDGTDDYLVASLSSTIAASSRPYVWFVFRATASTTVVPLSFRYTGDAGTTLYFVIESPNFRVAIGSTDSGAPDTIFGPAYDTALHLHEVGWLTGSAGRYVVDGVPYNGSHTGGTFRATDRIVLSALYTGVVANVAADEFYEVVVADSLPNADQLALMRDYFARDYGLNVIRSTLLLDNLSVAAAGAYSCYRRLRMAYTGSALLARRADNTELGFGFTAAGVLDTAALLSWAAGQSVYLKTLYDQSGNGRDLTQATTTKQPRLVNAGVLDLNSNGRIAPLFDGIDDTLVRADALGFSGSQDITVGWACTLGNAASTYSNPWGIGGTALSGDVLACGSNVSATQMNMARGGAFYRTFTTSNMVNPHYYTARWAAGAPVSSMDLRQDGSTLSGSTTGPSGTTSYVNQSFSMGSFFDTIGAGYIQGWMNSLFVFKSVLSGTDLSVLEAELAAHA